jgi:SIR2-like domain
MDDRDWDVLLGRIADGRCTPFIGAGAAFGTLPLGSDIAERWARTSQYPLEDDKDLSAVAQFVGIAHHDAMWPKDEIRRELEGKAPPDFSRPDEPHAVLADLPLPIYLTTNYDDFMTQALRRRGREPVREFCRWNSSPTVRGRRPAPELAPSPSAPVVYHLHGHLGVRESIVLTEDDYLDFLVAVSRDEPVLPSEIETALATSSLLFIGYRLADWSFRVIHRGLVMGREGTLRTLGVTVQLRHTQAAEAYLADYFGAMNVRVYWGTAAEFAAELRARWGDFNGGR